MCVQLTLLLRMLLPIRSLCCSVVQCVAARCSEVKCGAVWCSVLQCIEVCCSVRVHCCYITLPIRCVCLYMYVCVCVNVYVSVCVSFL